MDEDASFWWREACARSAGVIDNAPPGSYGYSLIEAGEALRARAYELAGIACGACHGYGMRAYGSTAVWMGGIGGSSITEGVCDKCWGSGRSDRTGADLRRAMAERRNHEHTIAQRDDEVRRLRRVVAVEHQRRGYVRPERCWSCLSLTTHACPDCEAATADGWDPSKPVDWEPVAKGEGK